VGAVGGAATTPSRGYYGYGYNEPGYYSYYGPGYGSVYYDPVTELLGIVSSSCLWAKRYKVILLQLRFAIGSPPWLEGSGASTASETGRGGTASRAARRQSFGPAPDHVRQLENV
jgi:hypothetical protein